MTGTARVITASNRAAAGVYPDRSGPLIVEWLRERGFDDPGADGGRPTASRSARRCGRPSPTGSTS